MAITIMVNRVRKIAVKNADILKINRSPRNTTEFTQDMMKWMDWLAKTDEVDDIGTVILQRITLSVRDNYGMLTNALQELTNWENYYKKRVSYYKKERDKERYLIGDFGQEKEVEADELDIVTEEVKEEPVTVVEEVKKETVTVVEEVKEEPVILIEESEN
jgi:hypothetical protein